MVTHILNIYRNLFQTLLQNCTADFTMEDFAEEEISPQAYFGNVLHCSLFGHHLCNTSVINCV